jgi:hypothetical protein
MSHSDGNAISEDVAIEQALLEDQVELSESSESEEPSFEFLDGLNKDTLCNAIYASIQKRYREQINLSAIADLINVLDLSDYLPESKAPQLQIQRLRFTGEKHLNMQELPVPIDYSQVFKPGVNVLLVESNEVGKSSIWKTIKFALTGDDREYDADVKTWIVSIWLTFALDGQPYTMLLSRDSGETRGALVSGEVHDDFDEAITAASPVFTAKDSEELKAELQHFFFNRLGLSSLSWTQESTLGETAVAERKASWLTYFQALLIPDGGDRYLLCDPQHSYGNQAGLILSVFLGLSFADPLNKLGIDKAVAKKSIERTKQVSEHEKAQAEVQLQELETELTRVRSRLAAIVAEQQKRRHAVESAESNRIVLDMQLRFEEKQKELAALTTERDRLGLAIQKDRGRERQLREAIALQLHFTGISVTLCPNCDTPISEDSTLREQETHMCRLCGSPAHMAPAEEIEAMKAEAAAADKRRANAERSRDAIWRRMGELRTELSDTTDAIARARQAAAEGMAYAFPSPAEEEERENLLTRSGVIQRDLTLARDKLQGRQPELDRLDLQRRVIEKARDLIKQEAARRNQVKLTRLGELTQHVSSQIGAESVTDVTITPYGVARLQKHGKPITFNGINNDGERLRIKLAFFLAMMQLGREPNGGRHPGFLIIDQPGSNEMVTSDFVALAQVFRNIDREFDDQIQILCFTARPEFAEATDESRVYGPQAAPYAF